MREPELREWFRSEQPMLKAWGGYVRVKLESLIEQHHKPDRHFALGYFCKVPVSFRVKGEASLVEKAFLRKRDTPYADPRTEITDLVGVRVVVLLEEQVRLVGSLIEAVEEWSYEQTRDFDKQRSSSPEHFTYESVHYIIKNSRPVTFDGVEIRPGTPCEIQVRTLLQHAQSELTHDRVYKTKVQIDSTVKRDVSRSAALVETTDEIFQRVDKKMAEAIKNQKDLLEGLDAALFSRAPDLKELFNDRLNDYVFSALEPLANSLNIDAAAVESFVRDPANAHVIGKLQERSSWDILAAQPVSLLIYVLVRKAFKERLKGQETWNLPLDQLEPYFLDLGKPF